MAYQHDIIDGNDAVLTPSGWRATRIATVYGISDAIAGHAKILAAYIEVGVAIGDIHPTFTTAYCTEITPAAISSDVVTLRYTYTEDPPVLYSGGSTGASEDSNQYFNGSYWDDIELEYTFPEDYPEQERAGRLETVSAIVTRLLPEKSLTITRTERLTLAIDSGGAGNAINNTILSNRANAYQGYVNKGIGLGGDSNSGSWDLRPSDYKRSWLCSSIEYESRDGGISYDVTYTFIGRNYRAVIGVGANPIQFQYGWDSLVVFVDPNTGKPVAEAVWDKSKKIVQEYEEREFSDLELA